MSYKTYPGRTCHLCTCKKCGAVWETGDWQHHFTTYQGDCHKCHSTDIAVTCPIEMTPLKSPVKICPRFAETEQGLIAFDRINYSIV
jgi:hypothetical protein